jgi:uncharacterized protein involved in exopolysaccharide biosynthesis
VLLGILSATRGELLLPGLFRRYPQIRSRIILPVKAREGLSPLEHTLMASFRLRTPIEYLELLWRKRYFLIIPFVIVAASSSYAIYKLPNMYESQSMIIVDPPKVSATIAQPVTAIDVNSRLTMIRKLVTSRTELQRIIERFDLYPQLAARNAPMEETVTEMLKHISVKQNAASQTINDFTVHFRHPDPVKARDVAQELTTRIINAHSDQTMQQTYFTVDQIEERVKGVRTELEVIEAKRADYLLNNPQVMEGQDQNLASQLNSLSLTRQSQQTSIDSLRNQITTAEQMVATLKAQTEITQQDPEMSSATASIVGQLRTERAKLDGELQKLLTEYTPKAPEVKVLKAHLESINREIEDVLKKEEVANQNKLNKMAQRPSGSLQIQQMELNIAADKRNLEIKEKDLVGTIGQINELRGKLGSLPIKAIEGLKIDRDYTTLRDRYNDLIKQQDAAKFSAKLLNDFSGETFRLIDPASLPERPVSPKRGVLYPLSFLLSLLVGLLAAAASAGRELLTIRDARDIAHYAHLPLLVTVPRLVTQKERQLLPFVNAAKLIGAIVLIGLITPLLYQLIKVSGLLNVFTQAAF